MSNALLRWSIIGAVLQSVCVPFLVLFQATFGISGLSSPACLLWSISAVAVRTSHATAHTIIRLVRAACVRRSRCCWWRVAQGRLGRQALRSKAGTRSCPQKAFRHRRERAAGLAVRGCSVSRERTAGIAQPSSPGRDLAMGANVFFSPRATGDTRRRQHLLCSCTDTFSARGEGVALGTLFLPASSHHELPSPASQDVAAGVTSFSTLSTGAELEALRGRL
eukprot:3367325-Pleurochrysis_carterae.AAC.1